MKDTLNSARENWHHAVEIYCKSAGLRIAIRPNKVEVIDVTAAGELLAKAATSLAFELEGAGMDSTPCLRLVDTIDLTPKKVTAKLVSEVHYLVTRIEMRQVTDMIARCASKGKLAENAELPINEAAAFCGLTRETLRGWVRRKRKPLPVRHLAGQIVVKLSDVEREISAKKARNSTMNSTKSNPTQPSARRKAVSKKKKR